jgi:hypothetical protein
MSTTFRLAELANVPAGRYRLDTAAGSTTPAADLSLTEPLLRVKRGHQPGPVRSSTGRTVLYGKRLGVLGQVLATVTLSADATMAEPTPVGQAALDAAVSTAVAGLVNGAPGALNTLEELADALGDDANYAATVAAALAARLTTVSHGSTAGTARPASALPVLWIGTVAPTSATARDLWLDETTPALQRTDGSTWTALGAGTSVASTVVAKTAAYAAVNGDVVLADASGGDFPVTLPVPTSGGKVTVKNVGASGTVTVAPHAAESVEGTSSYAIATQHLSRDFLSDGTDWWVV